MKTALLEIIRCPKTGKELHLQTPVYANGEVKEGWLITENGEHKYPITNYIPRFVPQSNYADNFGMQWNHFSKTQLDSYSGHPITGERFWKATGWNKEDLKGKWVLDVGCGAGSFAEVVSATSAQLVALDHSSAIDTCYSNLKQFSNAHFVQGDIYELPFEKEQFKYVYSPWRITAHA